MKNRGGKIKLIGRRGRREEGRSAREREVGKEGERDTEREREREKMAFCEFICN